MKLRKADVEGILTASFPEYKGRKFRLELRDKYNPHSFWDGGSRDYFVALRWNGEGWQAIGDKDIPGLTNPFRIQAHQPIAITEDVLVVEHSIFQGKDIGITIYAHPNSKYLPKLLPGGQS